jgi:hypothetical protein
VRAELRIGDWPDGAEKVTRRQAMIASSWLRSVSHEICM